MIAPEITVILGRTASPEDNEQDDAKDAESNHSRHLYIERTMEQGQLTPVTMSTSPGLP